MNKRFSLLSRADEGTVAPDFTPIKNLLLDQSLEKLCTNARAVRYFTNVLASPPKLAENSRYRAEILQDFHAHPLALSRLSACLQTLDSIPDEYQNERSLNKTSAVFGSDARFKTASMQIILGASTILDFFERLREIGELIERSDFKSEGFCALHTRITELLSSEKFEELSEILRQFVSLPEDYRIELQFTLNALGRFKEYDILAIETMQLKEAQAVGWKRFFQSKSALRARQEVKEYAATEGVHFETFANDLLNRSVGGVYEKLSEILNRILQGLFSEFCGMAPELQFYQVALSILSFYEKKEIPFCYPQYTAEKTIRFSALKDFTLLVEGYGEQTVVPNDVNITAQKPGILISGENNSGKTVYLRSIASALLFAQSGLPVPAQDGEISPYRSIYTLFATGEKAATIGLGAGRFEEEVSALSEIVDRLHEGDLIFLNEIFQTTSYQEGARGLYHILQHLSRRGVRFICVSHLTDLFKLFSKEEVQMLKTSDPQGSLPFKLLPF